MCRKRLWRQISCCCAYLVCCTMAWGQSDCPEAIVICDDGVINFSPSPFTAEDDFINPNNDPGCLLTLEVRSVWYYFSFRSDMPPNSIIEFTMLPIPLPNDPLGFVDYDFAIYGPDLTCDSLGSPLRCSFARFDTTPGCIDCNDTGLGMGATDLSEPAVGQDGFVAPMVVQPGEGYYLLVDNFVGDSDAFSLTWGGSAKPFLNCITDPACNQLGLVTAPEQNVCEDVTEITLTPIISGASDSLSFSWSGDSIHLLDQVDTLQPNLLVPEDFIGELSFTLTISENGCSQSGIFEFAFTGESAGNLISAGPTAACIGDSIDYSVNAGFVDYEWSTGDTTREVRLAAGQTYTVTATAISGCQAVEQIEVPLHPQQTVSILGDSTLCTNAQGSLYAPAGFASYAWSTGATQDTIIIDTASPYSLTVTDQNACIYETQTVVQALNSPAASINGPLAICADTTATLSLDDTYASYQWSNNSQSASITVADAGTYAVVVTADNSCPDTAYFALTVHDLPVVDFPAEQFLCPDASLDLVASDQFSNYMWSTGESTSTITVSDEGLYTLQVQDANGCQTTAQTQLSHFVIPELTLSGDASFCTGEAAYVYANSDFIEYDWSTGSDSLSTAVSASGWVQLEVTDNNDCVQIDSFLVEELAGPTPELAVTPSICGNQETEIFLTTAYDSYAWSNGSTMASTSIDQPGQYEVTVTNSDACSEVLSFQISEYPAFEAEIMGEPFICTGSSTILSTNPEVVSHYWSDEDTLSTLQVTDAGHYQLIAQDANGCLDTASFTLSHYPEQPPQLPDTLAICENETATLAIADVYTSYQWSTGETDASIMVQQAGEVSVAVTDQNGCVYTAFAAIEINEHPIADFSGITGFCEGSSTQITAVAGYETYQWSTGSTDSILLVDTPGAYQLVVSSSEGCRDSIGFLVEEWPQPEPGILGPPGFCVGENVQLESDQNYPVYLWNDLSDQAQISVNSAGTYSLTVTDERGCSASTDHTLMQWDLPVISVGGDTSFCEGTSTTLTATGNFSQLSWPDGSQNSTWTTDQTGSQIVQAVNSFGCANTLSFTLHENPLPTAIITQPDAIDCDNNGVTLSAILDLIDQVVYQWTGPGIDAQNANLATPTVNEAGIYTLMVMDATTGCSSLLTETEVISIVDMPSPTLTTLDTLSCVQNNATIQINNIGGNAADWMFSWLGPNGEPVTGDDFNLTVEQAGTYQLTVTHLSTNCQGSAAIDVMQNIDAPQVEVNDITPLDCNTTETSLSILIDSDGAPFVVNWTLPDQSQLTQTSTTLMTSQVGDHGLSVLRLDNGCQFTDVLTVEDLSDPPTATITAVGQLDCQNQPITLSASVAPLGENWTYAWYLDQQLISQQPTHATLATGQHILEVTNTDNGCISYDTLLVSRLDNGPLEPIFLAEAESCQGANDGSILLEEPTAGTAPFQYQLDGGPLSTQTNFNNLSPGLHELVVTDARGCSVSFDVTIDPGSVLDVHLNGPVLIELGESARVRAIPTTSGQALTSFHWTMDNGRSCDTCDDNWQLDGLQEGGIVQVDVTDENGCTATDTTQIIIYSDYAVYIPNGFSPNNDGRNDSFTVFGDTEVEIVEKLIILDRWGNLVFQKFNFAHNDLQWGWDGTFRNQDSPMAVYAYFAVVRFIDGTTKDFKGDVTLIR